jgi:hypothetical protein
MGCDIASAKATLTGTMLMQTLEILLAGIATTKIFW